MTQPEAIKMLADWGAARCYDISEGSEDFAGVWATNKYLEMVQANVAALMNHWHSPLCKPETIAGAAIDLTHATIQALHDGSKP